MWIDATGRQLSGRWGSLADNLRDRWDDLSGPGKAGAIAAAAVAACGAVLLVLGLSGVMGGPTRGEDPVALAKLVAAPEFAALPAEQKRSYMRRVRKHMKQIEAARRAGDIDKRAYRVAYVCTWMERKLEDMEDYYKTPAARRQAWLDEELGGADGGGGDGGARTMSASGSASRGGGKTTAAAGVSSDGGLLYDDEEGKAKLEEEKDDFEDEFLQTWTPHGRRQWEEFRAAYKKRRDALKAKAKPSGGSAQAAPAAAHRAAWGAPRPSAAGAA